MANNSRSFTTLGVLGLGSLAVSAAFLGLSSATASADVEEMAPTPR